jgi:putative copper export protein
MAGRTPGPLVATIYGQLFGAKLVLVTGAALAAIVNRMVTLPSLRDAQDDRAYQSAARTFNRTMALEATALLVVLIVAGILAHTSPLHS